MRLDHSLLFGVIIGLVMGSLYTTELAMYVPLLIIASVVLIFSHIIKTK